MAEPPFARDTRHVTCRPNQPSQHKQCQLGLKGTETRQDKGRLSDFRDSTGRKQSNRAIWLHTYVNLQGKGRMTPKAV